MTPTNGKPKPGLARFMGRKSAGDDWLRPAITRYYSRIIAPGWKKEPSRKISPSSSYDPCPRALQFKMLGYDTGSTEEGRRKMDNGTKMHERWEGVFLEMGISASAEQFLANETTQGTYDLVLARIDEGMVVDPNKDLDPDLLYLVDLKSIKQELYRKLPVPSNFGPSNLGALAKLHPGYISQWLEYDKLLLDNGCDVGRGYLFFENKNTQAYQYYFLTRDEPLRLALLANAHTALKWNRAGKFMGMPFQKTSKTCQDCYVRNICFREHEGDQGVRAEVKSRLTQVAKKG